MKEKNIQNLFGKWLHKHKAVKVSTAFELKLCKTKSWPYTSIADHQIAGLYDAKHGGLYHKLSDMSRGTKPWDCFYMVNAEAYVVLVYYTPREKKIMIWIDIDDFIMEMKSSRRKSLTERRAKEIGIVIPLAG